MSRLPEIPNQDCIPNDPKLHAARLKPHAAHEGWCVQVAVRFFVGFALPVIALPVAVLVAGVVWFLSRQHH